MLTQTDIQLLRKEFFEPINQHFEIVDKRFDGIDIRLEKLEVRMNNVETVLTDHSAKLITLQNTVDEIDTYLRGAQREFLQSLNVDSIKHGKVLKDHERRLISLNA